MDDRRFDALTRRLATGTNARRSLLKGLAGAGLAAVFGRVAVEAAAAAPDDDGRCRRKPAISDNRCSEESLCRSTDAQICACTRTVDGARACVDLTDVACPSRDECDADRDCRGEDVCVKVGGCCESRRNLCAAPCARQRDRRSSRAAASGVRSPLLGR